MENSLKDLLNYLATSIVDEPDKVEIEEEQIGDGKTALRLRVAQPDMGKIIGRQGKTAKAIRVLLSAAAAKRGIFFTMDIVD
ncbi:MAG: KH domain-containing protein [Candidatus Dadabacteria bacterium]|nr:KH domain-containing protein [Candidatus Dadabacteria bacterium]MCY4042333.1 KH domain-containing protein [Candidatus Dadabacteria bacterium]MCY4047825.1 KH domain-containing protein [Candidatus Dadabacteria bacterium]